MWEKLLLPEFCIFFSKNLAKIRLLGGLPSLNNIILRLDLISFLFAIKRTYNLPEK